MAMRNFAAGEVLVNASARTIVTLKEKRMLSVQPLNCTLKRGHGEPSSTDAMIAVLAK